MKKFKIVSLVLVMLMSIMLFTGCSKDDIPDITIPGVIEDVLDSMTEGDVAEGHTPVDKENVPSQDPVNNEIPAYNGKDFVEINGNNPYFTAKEITSEAFENYGDLDHLGRCTTAMACLGKETMPTEKRGEIGMIKPTGWHTVKYDCVDGKYLYNRCHLIGFQLSAENANKQNLITGTRYFNVQGMLPFENMVADYIKETNNHVMYRVIPVFDEDNLVANGVSMEALSVEDNGEGICFNVFVYNIQPSITIDYATGESHQSDEKQNEPAATEQKEQSAEKDYVLNTNSHKFHDPSCSSVSKMSDKNKQEFHGTRDELIAQGYEPCGSCKP